MDIVKKRGRHALKIYDKEDPEADAKLHTQMFYKRFGEEAHIKQKYIKYIVRSFITTFKEMIAEGYVVKLDGIGDFFLASEITDLKCRYTPLYKKFIFAGVKPILHFKISKKWKEALIRVVTEKDAYIEDPIAFDFNPNYYYLGYIRNKNMAVTEVERGIGRKRRPEVIYTVEDIERKCEEYGLHFPDFTGEKRKLKSPEVAEAIRAYCGIKESKDEPT